MAGTNKPDRVGSRYVKNFEGRGMGTPGQGKFPRKAATNKNVGGSDMAAPNNAPQRSGAVSAGKAAYKRSHVGVSPTGLPFKRQPEGSVLSKGAQPNGRTKSQNMAVRKGAD